tara:strand:+ start:285 stop:668 length:384 start_codon:yes stop_codon:yes gene_type:complete
MKKSNRRKAIDCKLVKESSTYEGYFKYIVTVEDTDGSISQHPSYGKDMQDAIRRLVRSEHADKVVKVVEKKQHFFVFALFALCILIPLLGGVFNQENINVWLVLPLITIMIIFLVFELVERFRSKSD